MRVGPLAFLLMFLVACASNSKPTVTTELPKDTIQITLLPRIAISYEPTSITCRIPDVKYGRYVIGVSGLFSSEGPIESIIVYRVFTMPCYPVTVYCGYQEYNVETGWQKQHMSRLDLEPAGECR